VTLINEALLLQKGKELEMTNDVEAEVNRRMLEVAREQGIPTIVKLEEAMRANGMDPAATRQTMRVEMMKQAVIQHEVDSKVFFGWTNKELKDYFAAHPEKFKKPESVTISEIYLSLIGKTEADVKARATELVSQLRAGVSFAQLATANSEREEKGERTAPKTQGKVGTFEVPNLREDIATAIKTVKVGGVTDPIRIGDGYQILRVDERIAASDTAVFNENQVREAMTIERGPKQREEYIQTLRNDAYIKVSDSYNEAVCPLLKLNTATTAKSGDKDKKNEKGKKP
jgi:parvulin-like peptidyl-prolyl isomerase